MRRVHVVLAASAVAAALVLACCRRDESTSPTAVPVPPAIELVPALSDAQAGERIRIQVGVDVQEFRVVSAGDLEVKVESLIYHDGEPQGAPELLTWNRNSFGLPPEGVVRRVVQDRIEVGGRFWDCWRFEVHSRLGIRWYWLTSELPVHGLLQVAAVKNGNPDLGHAAKIVDWSFGENDPRNPHAK